MTRERGRSDAQRDGNKEDEAENDFSEQEMVTPLVDDVAEIGADEDHGDGVNHLRQRTEADDVDPDV